MSLLIYTFDPYFLYHRNWFEYHNLGHTPSINMILAHYLGNLINSYCSFIIDHSQWPSTTTRSGKVSLTKDKDKSKETVSSSGSSQPHLINDLTSNIRTWVKQASGSSSISFIQSSTHCSSLINRLEKSSHLKGMSMMSNLHILRESILRRNACYSKLGTSMSLLRIMRL